MNFQMKSFKFLYVIKIFEKKDILGFQLHIVHHVTHKKIIGSEKLLHYFSSPRIL